MGLDKENEAGYNIEVFSLQPGSRSVFMGSFHISDEDRAYHPYNSERVVAVRAYLPDTHLETVPAGTLIISGVADPNGGWLNVRVDRVKHDVKLVSA